MTWPGEKDAGPVARPLPRFHLQGLGSPGRCDLHGGSSPHPKARVGRADPGTGSASLPRLWEPLTTSRAPQVDLLQRPGIQPAVEQPGFQGWVISFSSKPEQLSRPSGSLLLGERTASAAGSWPLSRGLGTGSRSPARKKGMNKCYSRASLRKINPELVGQWTCSQKVLDLVKTVDVSASGCGPPPCCCWELRGTRGRRAADWVRRARIAARCSSDPLLKGQNGGREKAASRVAAEDSSVCWLGSSNPLRNVVWLFR